MVLKKTNQPNPKTLHFPKSLFLVQIIWNILFLKNNGINKLECTQYGKNRKILRSQYYLPVRWQKNKLVSHAEQAKPQACYNTQ